MAYWLTTHYPHAVPDDVDWHIYLQRPFKHVVSGIAKGDVVFFYEFKWHPANTHHTVYPQGREGIVRTGRVSGGIYERDALTRYEDGREMDWCWGVPTDKQEAHGFVPRGEMNRILGFQPGYNLRGFGGGTGVKRLSRVEGEALLALF